MPMWPCAVTKGGVRGDDIESIHDLDKDVPNLMDAALKPQPTRLRINDRVEVGLNNVRAKPGSTFHFWL